MFYDEKTRLRRGRGGALVSTCGVAVSESEESKSEEGERELGREGHQRAEASGGWWWPERNASRATVVGKVLGR